MGDECGLGLAGMEPVAEGLFVRESCLLRRSIHGSGAGHRMPDSGAGDERAKRSRGAQAGRPAEHLSGDGKERSLPSIGLRTLYTIWSREGP